MESTLSPLFDVVVDVDVDVFVLVVDVLPSGTSVSAEACSPRGWFAALEGGTEAFAGDIGLG